MSTVEEDDRPLWRALEDLETVIVERIRREQRRDQLTHLANDLALDEALEDAIGRRRHVWAAFVEVDKFKSINDRFGYQGGDNLLTAIARLLDGMAKTLPGEAQAFRAHGDEFYLFGASEAVIDHLADSLETMLRLVCTKVSNIAISIMNDSHAGAREMKCTVSVGWLVPGDLGVTLSARAIRDALERAVDEAKRNRNCAVRYSRALEQRESLSLRADCAQCRTKFSADVPLQAIRESPLHCPNCGHTVERPSLPEARAPIDERFG